MFSRFTSATSFAVVLGAALIGAVATPAVAGARGNCATTPAQLRNAAIAAEAGAQRKALMLVATGERLCAADAEFEARKKFAAAARALNVDLASLSATTAASAQ